MPNKANKLVMVRYYPINLNLEGKKCVVIGGGKVAQRKVKRLLDCGANVKLISPKLTPTLRVLTKNNKIEFKNRWFSLRDISNVFLVICASNNRRVNSLVSSYCRKKGILVNVVDSPKECNFILPSVVRRGNLTISISTDGISPALTKEIRQNLEKRFGIEYAKFLRIMQKMRPEAIRKIKGLKSRKAFFSRAIRSDIFNLLKKNKEKQVRQKLERILQG
jgi:precorrin-2 dehydrogenase/sirohydrochlorin ferrochelatase